MLNRPNSAQFSYVAKAVSDALERFKMAQGLHQHSMSHHVIICINQIKGDTSHCSLKQLDGKMMTDKQQCETASKDGLDTARSMHQPSSPSS